MNHTPYFVQINQAFDISAPDDVVVEGFSSDATLPGIPTKQDDYQFRREALRDVLAFLSAPQGDGLFLTGPTGSGKTSLINQVAARLNWPVQQVTGHGHLELSDLIGYPGLDNGSMTFLPGPLTCAMEQGCLFLLDEIDLIDPSVLAGLNSVLEGGQLMLTQSQGRIIQPHPMFRIIVTANSVGQGDTTGLYQGVLRQNLAFMDRFRVTVVDYAGCQTELALLETVTPELPVELRKKMRKVANEVRRLFTGDDSSSPQLTITFSTRTLLRWARLTLTFKGAPNAIEYALERALTARAEPEQRTAIHRIAEDIFADHWDVNT